MRYGEKIEQVLYTIIILIFNVKNYCTNYCPPKKFMPILKVRKKFHAQKIANPNSTPLPPPSQEKYFIVHPLAFVAMWFCT